MIDEEFDDDDEGEGEVWTNFIAVLHFTAMSVFKLVLAPLLLPSYW